MDEYIVATELAGMEDAVSTMSSSETFAEKSVTEKYDIGNVVVTPEATNSIKKPSKKKSTPKPEDLTRLQSINGVDICNFSVDKLRNFLAQNRNRIKGLSKSNKREICEAIADAHIRYTTDIKVHGMQPDKAGLLVDVDLTKDAPPKPKINLFRLTNVLFGETLKPFLRDRGGTMTKEDLDVGKKKDQDLYEAMLKEYNDRG